MRIEKSKAYILMLYVALAMFLLFWMPVKAQVKRTDGKPEGPVDLLTWPEASQTAAREMRGKYGKPDAECHDMVIWMDKKDWMMITVTKAESRHSFPLEHTDVLEQTVRYRVPVDKYQELAEFDGSITINRTRGTLSSRCDNEGYNILTLNLAHDIIIGKRTVDDARKEYSNLIREKMIGGNPEYMQRLLFTAQDDTGDTDINTTGLTKGGGVLITKTTSAKSDL
jgi:hypothetical protein